MPLPLLGKPAHRSRCTQGQRWCARRPRAPLVKHLVLVAWHVSWNAGRRCTLTPWSHRLSSRLRGAECCEAGHNVLIELQRLPTLARMYQHKTEILSNVTSADQRQHCLRAGGHCSDLISGAGAPAVSCAGALGAAHLQLKQRAPAAKALESTLHPPWQVAIAGAVRAFCAASSRCCRGAPCEAIDCCSRCGQHAACCRCAAAAAIEGRCPCRLEMRLKMFHTTGPHWNSCVRVNVNSDWENATRLPGCLLMWHSQVCVFPCVPALIERLEASTSIN